MSVREYIGARYVPVFADPIEWDATRTYEPLVVVTYQGNSYTSRQAVPANIPITNTTYWAQTGNYNAQVEQYRQEVATFDGRIDELEGTVSPYTSNSTIKSAIQAEASARQSAVSAEASARQSADNALQILTERNAVYIGNSYTDGVGDEQGAGGLFGRTKDVLFDHAYKFTSSGAGFTPYATTTQFITLLQQAISSTAFNNDSITDIVVIAAAGEGLALHNSPANYKSGLFTAISQFTTLARDNFSNLKKIFVVLAEAQQTPFHTTAGTVLEPQITPLINKTMRVACNDVGYVVYGGWIGWEIQYISSFFYDSIHPNYNGYKILASSFINAYYGNYKPTIFTMRSIIDNMFGSNNSYVRAILNMSSNGEYFNIFSENLLIGNYADADIPSWQGGWNDIKAFNEVNAGAATNKITPLPILNSISEAIMNLPAIIYNTDPTGNTNSSVRTVNTRISFDSTDKQIKLQGNGFMPAVGSYAPIQHMQYMVHYEVPTL